MHSIIRTFPSASASFRFLGLLLIVLACAPSADDSGIIITNWLQTDFRRQLFRLKVLKIEWVVVWLFEYSRNASFEMSIVANISSCFAKGPPLKLEISQFVAILNTISYHVVGNSSFIWMVELSLWSHCIRKYKSSLKWFGAEIRST